MNKGNEPLVYRLRSRRSNHYTTAPATTPPRRQIGKNSRLLEKKLFIVERGLAFQGFDENFGSELNGNFMRIVESISEFDQTLKQNTEKSTKCGCPPFK